MKKIIFLALLLISVKGYSQVTKSDFTEIFTQFKMSDMTKIVVNNVHVYYTDGTSKWSYYEYTTEDTDIEVKDNAVYIRWYTDKTKTTLRSYYIIPFRNMATVSGSKKQLTIDLME